MGVQSIDFTMGILQKKNLWMLNLSISLQTSFKKQACGAPGVDFDTGVLRWMLKVLISLRTSFKKQAYVCC
jgi:hypothetical protein